MRFFPWLFGFFVIALFFSHRNGALLSFPYPPVSKSISANFVFPDVLMMSAGFRRLTADIAWMGLLQTCVPARSPHSHEELPAKDQGEETGYVHCEQFKEKAWRVIKSDPYFQPAYFYSSLFLALEPVFHDPVGALELLEYGLKINPGNVYLRQYSGIITYQTQAAWDKALPLLEEAVKDKEAPALLLSLLARLYEQKGEYKKALFLWQRVLQGPEKNFWGRAQNAIEEIKIKRAARRGQN